MKKYVLFLILAVFCFVSLLAGCGVNQAVSDSQDMLENYYSNFSSQDFSKIMPMFHEELADEFGGKENMQILLMARRTLLGEQNNYTLTGTSFEVNNNITQVTLTVKTDYSLGESPEEEFIFTKIGSDISISGFYFDKEAVTKTIADDFFAAFGDAQSMVDLYIPALQDEQLIANMQNNIQQIASAAGEYQSYTLTDEYYYYQPHEGIAAIFVYEGTYTLHFDGMDIGCDLQLSEQDGFIGVNHFSYYELS